MHFYIRAKYYPFRNVDYFGWCQTSLGQCPSPKNILRNREKKRKEKERNEKKKNIEKLVFAYRSKTGKNIILKASMVNG